MIESEVIVENVTLFYVHFKFAVSILYQRHKRILITLMLGICILKSKCFAHSSHSSAVTKKLNSVLICGCHSPLKLIH